jgi:hypothetical protein
MDWGLHREVSSDSNGYDRYHDPEGGNAVLYEHAGRRECEVWINGLRVVEDGHDVPWPDTAAWYGGDQGRPVAYRLRYEAGAWWLYAYVYSGGDNRSEWARQLL